MFLGLGMSFRFAQDAGEQIVFAGDMFGFGLRPWSALQLAGRFCGIGFICRSQSSSQSRMQVTRNFFAFLQRQLGNRSLDFSNRAHAGKLSARRTGVNADWAAGQYFANRVSHARRARFEFYPAIRGRKSDNDESPQHAMNGFLEIPSPRARGQRRDCGREIQTCHKPPRNNRAANGLSR